MWIDFVSEKFQLGGIPNAVFFTMFSGCVVKRQINFREAKNKNKSYNSHREYDKLEIIEMEHIIAQETDIDMGLMLKVTEAG